MAEAIAIVASVIAVIQLSDRLVGVVKTFIESSKDAPKDFRVILNEISTLKTIFENLKFLIQVNGADSVLLPRLEGPGGPVEGCQVAIKELTQLITEGFDEPVRNSQKKKKIGCWRADYRSQESHVEIARQTCLAIKEIQGTEIAR